MRNDGEGTQRVSCYRLSVIGKNGISDDKTTDHGQQDNGTGAAIRICFPTTSSVRYPFNMSVQEIIEHIKALPPNERAQVAKFVVENDDSWIPDSFKQGMADAAAGQFADIETVLSGAKPPSRTAE